MSLFLWLRASEFYCVVPIFLATLRWCCAVGGWWDPPTWRHGEYEPRGAAKLHTILICWLNFSRSKSLFEAPKFKVCSEVKNYCFSLSNVYKNNMFSSIWTLGCFGSFQNGQIGVANLVQFLPVQLASFGWCCVGVVGVLVLMLHWCCVGALLRWCWVVGGWPDPPTWFSLSQFKLSTWATWADYLDEERLNQKFCTIPDTQRAWTMRKSTKRATQPKLGRC